jgi:glycine cleavage system regulatory protein
MRTYLVVTLACPDRPGIVDRVTEVMKQHSANWEESRMARLGGDFAGIVKIGVDPQRAAALADALRALADEQITVLVKSTQEAADEAVPASRIYELGLAGADHEGIVHRVAHYLASQGINVESMDTEVVPAPMSAAPVFHMEARIRVPEGLAATDLSANLERIGEELGVDIEVRLANT